MFCVLWDEMGREDGEFGEEGGKNGNVKGDRDDEGEDVEGVNIRSEENGILEVVSELIGGKKGECEREYEEIGEE